MSVVEESTVEVEVAPKVSAWERLRTLEPAVVRGVVVALVFVVGLVGFNIADVGEKVVAGYTALFALIPLIQAWWTRSAVVPASQVVAVVAPDGQVLAGPASPVADGEHVVVEKAARAETWLDFEDDGDY